MFVHPGFTARNAALVSGGGAGAGGGGDGSNAPEHIIKICCTYSQTETDHKTSLLHADTHWACTARINTAEVTPRLTLSLLGCACMHVHTRVCVWGGGG